MIHVVDVTHHYGIRPVLRAIVFVVGASVGFIRLVLYVAQQMPIGLRTRIGARRLIIPSYDCAVLGPAFVALVCPMSYSLLVNSGATESASFGFAIGFIVLAAATLPPGLRNWALTAEGRSSSVPTAMGR